MRNKAPLAAKIACLIAVLVLLVVLSACQTDGGQVSTTGEDSTVQVTVDENEFATHAPLTSLALLPSPTPAVLSNEFPPELIRSLDREVCPVHCWNEIAIGQTQAAAIAAIEDDPGYRRGGIEVSEVVDGVYVAWNRQHSGFPLSNSVFLVDNNVSEIDIVLETPFSYQMLLNELGEPDAFKITNMGPATSFLELFWTELALSFPIDMRLIDGLLVPEITPVTGVYFYDQEYLNVTELCHPTSTFYDPKWIELITDGSYALGVDGSPPLPEELPQYALCTE